jgi:hypothetical protein
LIVAHLWISPFPECFQISAANFQEPQIPLPGWVSLLLIFVCFILFHQVEFLQVNDQDILASAKQIRQDVEASSVGIAPARNQVFFFQSSLYQIC